MKFRIESMLFCFLVTYSGFIKASDLTFKSRLECIHLLTPISQKGSSSNFKFSENVKDMSMKDYTGALIGMDKTKNLMTLPAKRNGERGIYIYTDNGSFWYHLPKIVKKGEFQAQFLKIDNKQISKTPVYMTYYDGVESNGAEYSNKSVGLTTIKSELENINAFKSVDLMGILDNDSDTAFKENFKKLISTIHPVYLRHTENVPATKIPKIKDSFKSSLNKCEDLLKKSNDAEFLSLVQKASEEFNSNENIIPVEESKASAKK